MVRLVKFQTSSIRIGPLEGSALYRITLVTLAVLISIFYLGSYGFLSLILVPVFSIRIQHDYVDEYVLKKLRGITVSTLFPLITERKAAYEIFGTNYGLSEQQDRVIIDAWTSIIDTFSEDMTIIKHPYRVPLQRFIRGNEEYDSLFSGLNCFADAYFITILKERSDDFERTLRNYGIPFSKLAENEASALNDII